MLAKTNKNFYIILQEGIYKYQNICYNMVIIMGNVPFYRATYELRDEFLKTFFKTEENHV